MSKKITQMKIRIRNQRHELEGHVIDALENGATDVLEVVEYTQARMDVTDRNIARMAYKIMHVDDNVSNLHESPTF